MQRSYEEMMSLIIRIAEQDARVRAVTMEGSNASKIATHDKYSDFDICYIVSDVREFTKDKSWISCFGERLIVQCPDDWDTHPYDYQSRENFTFLIQLKDGNRIDLTVVDVTNISNEKENREPRTILLNKDNFSELQPLESNEAFYIKKPTEQEFFHTCNEFRWVSCYITKGLCRHEIYYAKHCYDVYVMDMFIKMLNWKVGVDNDFSVTTGASSKYLKRYLSEEEMKRFQGIFPNGEYKDIWEKLFRMYDYFEENANYVAEKLGFPYDKLEATNVRKFHEERMRSISKTE